MPVSPHRPLVGPMPRQQPVRREPPRTPAAVCSGRPSLETQVCKRDVFGELDSHPVQSGNIASGRLCHSGKLTESHHLCHETWLTLCEDLDSAVPALQSTVSAAPGAGGAGGGAWGGLTCLPGRPRTRAQAGLQRVSEPAPGSAWRSPAGKGGDQGEPSRLPSGAPHSLPL